MALAFTLVLSVSRLGDFLALSLGANIAQWFGAFTWTLIVACGLCVVSLLFTILYFFVDKYSERRYYRKPVEPTPFGLETFKCVLRFDVRFWIVSLLCMT
jgi:hypothetical protein